MLTAHGSIETAIQAMKQRRLRLPHQAVPPARAGSPRPEGLREGAARPPRAAVGRSRSRYESPRYRLVGSSPAMQTRRAADREGGRRPTPPCWSAARAAPARSWSPAPSTPTARARDRPLVTINCAALAGDAAGERAVRPREGRLHRRGAGQAGPVRGGRRRHAVPRRDRRDGRRPAGQAAARAGGRPLPPRRRHRRRCTPTCASSRPPTAAWRRRSRPAASARTCTTASTWSRSTCRRCASGAEDIPALVEHFLTTRQVGPAPLPDRPGGAGGAAALRLAGQRARAGQRAGAGADPGRGPRHHAGRPAGELSSRPGHAAPARRRTRRPAPPARGRAAARPGRSCGRRRATRSRPPAPWASAAAPCTGCSTSTASATWGKQRQASEGSGRAGR